MPSSLALLCTVAFVVFLFRRDLQANPKVSGALWIPLVWVFLTGSRFVSQWLGVLGLQGGEGAVEDGSPIDALVFLGLILGGIHVLNQRRVNLQKIFRNNRWLGIFFIYCFLAIIWSDFPFVAFKRWIKTLGHPVMALILLTEPQAEAAVCSLMKRASFLLVPFSILLIKYYPEQGRGWDPWNGQATNRGMNLNKNELGYVCMLFGLFFFWDLLRALKISDRKAKREELILATGFLGMIFWLLNMAHSATSLACLVVGCLAMVVLGLRWINKKYIGAYVVGGIVILLGAELSLGLYENVVRALGRDPTLTDRTQVWHDALALHDSPILGAGFESFWLGKRLEILWEKWWWHPNQAHNGYIETYLNLGSVGVILLAGLFLGTFQKIKNELVRNFEFARLRVGFFIAILMYNYTEATFKGVHLVWTFFTLIALDYPKATVKRGIAAPQGAAAPRRAEEPALG